MQVAVYLWIISMLFTQASQLLRFMGFIESGTLFALIISSEGVFF